MAADAEEREKYAKAMQMLPHAQALQTAPMQPGVWGPMWTGIQRGIGGLMANSAAGQIQAYQAKIAERKSESASTISTYDDIMAYMRDYQLRADDPEVKQLFEIVKQKNSDLLEYADNVGELAGSALSAHETHTESAQTMHKMERQSQLQAMARQAAQANSMMLIAMAFGLKQFGGQQFAPGAGSVLAHAVGQKFPGLNAAMAVLETPGSEYSGVYGQSAAKEAGQMDPWTRARESLATYGHLLGANEFEYDGSRYTTFIPYIEMTNSDRDWDRITDRTTALGAQLTDEERPLVNAALTMLNQQTAANVSMTLGQAAPASYYTSGMSYDERIGAQAGLGDEALARLRPIMENVVEQMVELNESLGIEVPEALKKLPSLFGAAFRPKIQTPDGPMANTGPLTDEEMDKGGVHPSRWDDFRGLFDNMPLLQDYHKGLLDKKQTGNQPWFMTPKNTIITPEDYKDNILSTQLDPATLGTVVAKINAKYGTLENMKERMRELYAKYSGLKPHELQELEQILRTIRFEER